MGTRRRGGRVVLVAVLLLFAGCSAAVTGDGPVSFTATGASVSDAGLAETGYELLGNDTTEINRTVGVGGEERRIEITSHVATYGKTVEGAPLAQAVVISTPNAKLLGQSVNPLRFVNETQLVERAARDGREVRDVRRLNTTEVETLDTTAEVTMYEAVTDNGSTDANSYVHLTRIEHDGDYIIAAVLYPRGMENGRADALRLLEALRH